MLGPDQTGCASRLNCNCVCVVTRNKQQCSQRAAMRLDACRSLAVLSRHFCTGALGTSTRAAIRLATLFRQVERRVAPPPTPDFVTAQLIEHYQRLLSALQVGGGPLERHDEPGSALPPLAFPERRRWPTASGQLRCTAALSMPAAATQRGRAGLRCQPHWVCGVIPNTPAAPSRALVAGFTWGTSDSGGGRWQPRQGRPARSADASTAEAGSVGGGERRGGGRR